MNIIEKIDKYLLDGSAPFETEFRKKVVALRKKYTDTKDPMQKAHLLALIAAEEGLLARKKKAAEKTDGGK